MNQPSSATKLKLFCQVLAWFITTGAVALAITAWGSDHSYHFSQLNAYQVFPVLGLIAYSTMWSHYVASVIRRLLGLDFHTLKRYFAVTRFIVLACICLHPGILIYRLFRDGQGLPPSSYEHYVAPGLAWVTLLGSVSLLVFLTYELRPWFSKRSWWRYVTYAGDAAMVAIFYHGLRLGSQLQHGWFMKVWWFYGLTLIASLAFNYYQRFLRQTKSPTV
ncbi:MAG: hypothetical protein JWO41_235 [Candidatus Saccharibacteria bacterium]|nr:hypothetical protein [Candidatus Saccharibacteria bacterium]